MIKPPKTIQEQIELLLDRGMEFKELEKAPHFLSNISYYRLKGYWWEMQMDKVQHQFSEGSYFEDVISLYNFDRRFRLIVFNAIERIEVALRAKLIYHFSLSYGAGWHLNHNLFKDQSRHSDFLRKLKRDINNSSEEFIIKHLRNHTQESPESWKSLEIVTLGTLSKVFQNINHQLPEKSRIAKEFGLNNQKYLTSWLRSITYVRNIIAHHSRLWNRGLINRYDWPKNTRYPLLHNVPNQHERRKIFPLLSAILYMNNQISPGHHIKDNLLLLFAEFSGVPLSKMGFPLAWKNEPVWE